MKAHLMKIIPGLIFTAIFTTNVSAEGITVDTKGLDLTTLQGAQALYARIESAARRECNANMAPWDGQKIKYRNECVELVVEDAVARFNRPLLTRVHKAEVERLASL
jgi:UrcA family protein